MRIAHFAPFAPGQCGLYETTRDMIKAERLRGHTVALCDTGTGVGSKRRVGDVDNRGQCPIIAQDYPDVRGFDLFVSNNNIPASFLKQTSAPVVQIIHGRPESSFRLNQREKERAPVYDIYANMLKGDRVKLFVTLWPEHVPFWEVLIPREKLRATRFAPCDLDSFNERGPCHEWNGTRGAINLLIADIWRADADPFNVVHGIIAASEKIGGIKAHFYACQNPLGPWSYIFNSMRASGVLGETCGMMRNMADVFRAADLTLTPHRIATRIIRESLACGTPVIAGEPCRHTPYTAIPESPQSVARAIVRLASDLQRDRAGVRAQALQSARNFNLTEFAVNIEQFYREALTAS